mmetsp:Transcript_19688/g.49019  ORF Transcript_19688/g.49019 Transcript_19688/m.49019 type:complete len:81 (+) Transcript_19688:450-692(+)
MDTPEATLMIYTEKEGLAVYCAAVMGGMGLDMESVRCEEMWCAVGFGSGRSSAWFIDVGVSGGSSIKVFFGGAARRLSRH